MIPYYLYIIFIVLLAFEVVLFMLPPIQRTEHEEAERAGYDSYFEPRFKVDSMPRGCVARPFE